MACWLAVTPASPPMPGTGLAQLREIFGFDAFRGEQAAIVGHLVEGGDALVLMPTGGGKSLCYQLPALLREGTGIVVSPLIALMRSDEHTSELQSLMRNSYAVFCLKNTTT